MSYSRPKLHLQAWQSSSNSTDALSQMRQKLLIGHEHVAQRAGLPFAALGTNPKRNFNQATGAIRA